VAWTSHLALANRNSTPVKDSQTFQAVVLTAVPHDVAAARLRPAIHHALPVVNSTTQFAPNVANQLLSHLCPAKTALSIVAIASKRNAPHALAANTATVVLVVVVVVVVAVTVVAVIVTTAGNNRRIGEGNPVGLPFFFSFSLF